MARTKVGTLLSIISLYIIKLTAIDNPHFYRANYFWDEPRFETPWLSSIDLHISGGSSECARDSNGERSTLHNLYGLQNMHVLGNSPGLNPANPVDQILINLAQVPVPEDSLFAHLEYTGAFETIELICNSYFNICNGFFFQAYVPFRHFNIKRTNVFIDRTPDDLQNNPQWLAFLNNFPAILKQYNLSTQPIHQSGVGDFTLLAGWTRNYQETTHLDFIDVSAKLGILFPTGKTSNLQDVFDLPTGYNGFYGVPLKFDLSIGHWDWFTAGIHVGALFLLERDKIIRLQTVKDQPAYFLLFKGEGKVDPGTIFEIASFVKADHIYKGLSLLCGYCFTQKEPDCINPFNTDFFVPALTNLNPMRQSWDMHVMHFGASWDFAQKQTDIGPRIGFFYNLIVGGKRVFNTAIKDGYAGIDINWAV